MKKLILLLWIAVLSLLTACVRELAGQQSAAPVSFCIGADVSEIPGNEAFGTKYYDVDGKQDDPLKIMARHGFNTIRLRLFVNPEAEGGYSRAGHCGTASTVAFAKRIREAGMEFALNFHYSDNWADPDKQIKPSAWKDAQGAPLTGKALEDMVYRYTKETLETFKSAGAAPSIVQVGNEISHGFIWPEGKVMENAVESDWVKCMGLYKAGQKAVREVLPDAKLQVHLALGGENTLCRDFLNHMNLYGCEFDIIGLSYYEKWHETYDDMKANIHDLVKRYGKPVNICEYDAKENNIRTISDIVRTLPDSMGHGTMAWAPSGLLFPRGRANAQIFGIYESIRKDSVKPLDPVLCVAPAPRNVKIQEFILGADVSFLPSQEAHGMKFSDNGVQKDVFQILKDHHFNWIRLRLFVNPKAGNGYSKEGYCGLEQSLALAKRIKAAGMKLLVDLHYSDNWADPEKQTKPAAWASSYGSGLEGQVYSYTQDVVKRFIQEGVRPDMVQTGNEVNNGMVWPQGKIVDNSYESFAVMMRCATAGVRSADPSIPVMIHISSGGNNMKAVTFFDRLISRDVKFDVIGLSYYTKYQGTPEQLEYNVNNLAKRYGKQVCVVEYQDKIREVNDIMYRVPDGLGAGAFIWEATSPAWGNLFDSQGRTTDRMKIYDRFRQTMESRK